MKLSCHQFNSVLQSLGLVSLAMQSKISHFSKKTSKTKHDEHEEYDQEGFSSSIISVGTLDDSRVIGNDSA